MSYNVKNFDLYDWSKNENDRDSIFSIVKKEKPDIVAFQEFYTQNNSNFDNLKKMINELGYTHAHFEPSLTLKNNRQWGVAIFSKFPFINPQRVFPDKHINTAHFIDIVLSPKNYGVADTLRIFAAHLQSIHLGKNDLLYLNEIEHEITGKDTTTNDLNHLKSIGSIVTKLKTAFQQRAEQAELLAKFIQTSPHKVVLCGDFNDTPVSYTYNTISKNLQDAFLNTQYGMGRTYIGLLPHLRIDYIFLDKKLKIKDFNIIKKEHSDHYPITCTFSL